MNKEVEAIVEYLEENREQIYGLSYYPDDVLTSRQLIMLMDYIKQLENTLNEVRKYILEKCPHSAVFRNEHIDKIYEIIKK